MFLVQCGRMTQAMRTFQKNKDYASAPAHMLEYARNLLACAVYTSAWTQAGNHVSKLQQYLRKESNPTAQAGCYALNGLVHLNQSSYHTAAAWFLQTGLMLGTDFNDLKTLCKR